MKRLAMATVVLTGLAVVAQAGGLPKAPRLVDRIGPYHGTHGVTGSEKVEGSSQQASGTAEARQQEPTAKPQPKQKPKPAPQPARAD